MSFLDKLESVSRFKVALNAESFKKYVELFTNESLKDERLDFYRQFQKENSLPSLAHAKHELIKSVFGEYVSVNINRANTFANQKTTEKAIDIINNIASLREVFKSHDIVNYKEFILESEPNMTQTEVDLLFYESLLNNKELEKLTGAFIKALGKKNTVTDIEDFQRKFFSHPLIECLDAYSDLSDMKDKVEDGVLELFNYKNLVNLILEVKQSVNAEEYQSFITFIIKEDLTKGFANIIKTRDYEPKYLSEILKSISIGKTLNNEEVFNLIDEIKLNHTKNLRLVFGEIKYVNTSNQSLNDYGFGVKEKGLDFFFHGHATENHGEKQAEQQANTGLNIDVSGDYPNNIGLTVTKYSVLRNEHHKAYLRKEGLDEKLNVTKTEEIFMSNLIFDASYLKRLVKLVDDSVNSGFSPITKLRESSIFSTNHLIVKEDISRSQKIIMNTIGKNDFELICEKKNAYMNIFTKNKEFMTGILGQGSTNNYLVFELLGKPTMSLISNLLEIEEIANVKLFDDNEISFIREIASLNKRNASLDSDSVTINRTLRRRDSGKLEDVNVETFHTLSKFAEQDITKKEVVAKKEARVRDHAKTINKYMLSDALYYLDKNPLNSKDYNQTYKSRVVNSLVKNISESAENLLNYRSDKSDNMLYGIQEACRLLQDGYAVEFNKSDANVTSFSSNPEAKALSILSQDKNKTEQQILNDRLLFRAIIKVAEMSNGKIVCKNLEVTNKLKP